MSEGIVRMQKNLRSFLGQSLWQSSAQALSRIKAKGRRLQLHREDKLFLEKLQMGPQSSGTPNHVAVTPAKQVGVAEKQSLGPAHLFLSLVPSMLFRPIEWCLTWSHIEQVRDRDATQN